MKENRFTSRKFWLTVGVVISLIAQERYGEAVAALAAYLGANTAEKVVKPRRGKSAKD